MLFYGRGSIYTLAGRYYYYYLYKGTYNYIPETYHVCRVYIVAVILWLHYMILVMLFPMMNVW